MRIIGHMCVKNEAERYLASSVRSLVKTTDMCVVYDDRSDDDSVEVARSNGAYVKVRSKTAPSFLEAEGAFRQEGWDAMLSVAKPLPGDWIVVLDADEFFVSEYEPLSLAFVPDSYGTIIVPIHEVFNLDPLQVRTDGFWGSIRGARATRYRETTQVFKSTKMGCGVLPLYSLQSKSLKMDKLDIMHFGYAVEEDRQHKFYRYSSMEHGHSNDHINSIVSPRWTLKNWDGYVPNWKRGSK